MKFNLLQSGSAGNCTFIESNNAKILVDCGINKCDIVARLSHFNANLEEIDAIFITHEHIDHIKSINSMKNNIIYASKGTLNIDETNIIEPFKFYNIKDIKVMALPTSHDVVNGMGYIFADDELLVYLTDTGIVYDEVIPYIEDADYYLIEANYNLDMLYKTNRPPFLINRIKGERGHLSNTQCGEILSKVIGPHTKKIILSHISAESNTPELAIKEVTEILKRDGHDISKIDIRVASREYITEGN